MNKEKMEDYMAQVLFDAMANIINSPIESVADQIHYHRYGVYGYLRKL